MANFEVFHWNISSSTNLLLLRSELRALVNLSIEFPIRFFDILNLIKSGLDLKLDSTLTLLSPHVIT